MSRLGRFLAAHPWVAYAVLAALAFPIFEMLVHGERALQYAHDVFDDDVPRLFAIAADWRANGPVLWDPHLTAGNAWLAQFALPPLAPDVLLSFVASPFLAYAANYALMTFAAGTAMHLFLRDSLGLPALACFAGGILATFAFWHYIYGYAALLLPLVLWTTDRAFAETRRRRDVLAAILVVAFLFFSSQVQIVLLDGAIALAWVLITKVETRPAARAAGLVVIWAVALMLAAPILATQVVALPESQRAIWDISYLYPLGPSLQEVARLYGGIVLGVPVTAGVGGSADIYGTFFLGAIGLPLLVVGIVTPRSTARERLLLALLVAIPLIDVAVLLAAPLQEAIALLRSFQFVRIRHLMPVVLIVNAAFGVAWLAGPDPIGRLGPRRRIVAAIGLAAVGLAVAAQGVVALRHVVRPRGTDLVQDGWALTLVALALGVAVSAIVLFAVTIGRGRRDVAGRLALAGAVGLGLVLGLAGERLLYARAERAIGGNLGTWAASLAPTTAQAFIASRPAEGRVLSIGEHANRALAAGLDAVDGYETVYPLRYHELFGALIAPELAQNPARSVYYHGWGNRAYAFGPHLDMDVADLLGVRWLYVRGAPLEDPALTARFADDGVTVYENAGAFPRTFIAHALDVVADRPAIVAAIGSATADDLRNRVFLAAADAYALAGRPASLGPNPDDAATIETDALDRIVIRAKTSTPGFLVLADTYTPDWVVEVDGSPTPVLPVDGALRGVALAPGDHLVTFAYRPLATYVGIVLALGAVAGLAGWLVLGRLRRDRAARPLTPSDRVAAPPS